MNIFEFSDYRPIVDLYLKVGKSIRRGKKMELSEKLGIHSSHLSQVMAGHRSLTPDQMLVLAELLGLSELETEYAINLVHIERSVSFEFKKYGEKRALDLKLRAQKAVERFPHDKQLNEVNKAQFYSHYLYSAVRLYCSTSEKGRSLEELESKFNLTRDRIMPMIRFLLEAGLLNQKRDHYQMGIVSTFLSRESPHIHRHHANWRLLALHESPRLEEDELMFTAPMSISKKDFQKIREILMKEIAKISTVIKESPAEDIACLNLDLYWIKK
jgi:uncharacterized protein (TIGR02147 family)